MLVAAKMKTLSTHSVFGNIVDMQDNEIREVLHQLAAGLVKHKDKLTVQLEELRSSSLFVINCCVEDRGKVIGGGGETIRAFQSIGRTIGRIRGRGVAVSMFDEPGKKFTPSFEPKELNPEWSAEKFSEFIGATVSFVLAIQNIDVEFRKTGASYHFTCDLHKQGYDDDFETSDPKHPAVIPSLKRLFVAIAAANGATISLEFNP
jgi:predicted RNA-binding protein YlqC (UPF0109 family)